MNAGLLRPGQPLPPDDAPLTVRTAFAFDEWPPHHLRICDAWMGRFDVCTRPPGHPGEHSRVGCSEGC